jgi:hypothetical protein
MMAENSMLKKAYDVYKRSGETGLREWSMSLPADDLVEFLQEWLELKIQIHSLMKNYLTPIITDDRQEDK